MGANWSRGFLSKLWSENFLSQRNRIQKILSALERRMKNGEISVETHEGDVIPSRLLSSGTREQLSFCLRLSIAQKLLQKPSFLILDDPFLFCDSSRLETLLFLIETAIKNGWQILYFTFDERVVRYFKRSKLEPHYFQLN